MALPPCPPPHHHDLPGISFSPPPPQPRDLQAWQIQTTPGTQLPGARASPPYSGALFPLFLPPPSPIRIVCLNSTLTNMDSSGLGPAVITARPPSPGAGPTPPIFAEFYAAPRRRGGVQRALPSTPRCPHGPGHPGPEVYPGKGLARGSEDTSPRPTLLPAGRRVNTGARPNVAPWGRAGRGDAPPPVRRPYYLSLSWSSVPGSG